MAYVLVIHEVADYDKWAETFDLAFDFREQAGELSAQFFRNKENPNEVTALFEWEDMETARRFFSSPDLVTKMKDAGVVGRPKVMFLEEE